MINIFCPHYVINTTTHTHKRSPKATHFLPTFHGNESHSPVTLLFLCVLRLDPWLFLFSSVYKLSTSADPISRSFALLAEDKGSCCLLLLVGIAGWRMPCGSLRWEWCIKAFPDELRCNVGKGRTFACQYWHHRHRSGFMLQYFSENDLDFIGNRTFLRGRKKMKELLTMACGEALAFSLQCFGV